MSRPYRPGRAGSHQTFPSGSLSRGRSLLGQITTLGLAEVGADGEVDIVEPGTPLAELYGLSMKAIGPAAVEAGALTPEQAAALVERPNQPDFLACGSFTSASGGVVRRSRSRETRSTPLSTGDAL